MHVRKLEIWNFRAIDHLSLTFEDGMGKFRPVTVISGPNGCGKTSVLYAIIQALRGAMHLRVSEVPVPSDFDLHRTEPSGRRPVSARVGIKLEYGGPELKAIRHVFKMTAASRAHAGKPPVNPPELPKSEDSAYAGKLDVIWQYPPRVFSSGATASLFELRSEPKYGPVWLSAFSTAWGAWRSKVLSDVRDMYPIGGLRVFPQDRDRRWGIDVDEPDEGADQIGSGNIPTTARSRSREEPTVADALRTLGGFTFGKGLDQNDDRRQWEARLQERFERTCGPKRYLGYFLDHPRYGETPLFSDRGREYPFSRAASGEHVVLHYLTKLTFPRPVQNSVILIDEPELHLHPRWVRQLYRLFAESAKPIEKGGDSNQFIMTTHSPELRQLASRENALIDLGDLGEESQDAC
jgi:predicted ATPase